MDMYFQEEDFFNVSHCDLRVNDDNQNYFAYPEFVEDPEIRKVPEIFQSEPSHFYSPSDFEPGDFYHWSQENVEYNGTISSFLTISQSFISDSSPAIAQPKSGVLHIIRPTLKSDTPSKIDSVQTTKDVKDPHARPLMKISLSEKKDHLSTNNVETSNWTEKEVVSSPQILPKKCEVTEIVQGITSLTPIACPRIEFLNNAKNQYSFLRPKNCRSKNFTETQKDILVDYIKNNPENPYVTPSSLKELEYKTGLSPKQIRIFLTNYRSRHSLSTKMRKPLKMKMFE